jgi:glyceraldehyde-3-phosphate dehydrogenase (NADP+)
MEALDLEGFAPGKGHIGFMKRFPIGVIYGMTPFNFPLNLVMHKVAPAIASGNAIIVKPSPRTPLTALRIENLMRDSGCAGNQVQVVVCPNELAMKLAEDERVKMVSFTGSAAVGWQIRRHAAARRVTLELGGNAALIVHDDADLTAAVPATAAGAFGYAGQTCISVQRILVQNDVYDRFRDMFLQHVREKIRAGDPRERTTVVGPMIDGAAIERVRTSIDDAVRGGAKILCGGNVQGNVLEPTVLDHVDSHMKICTEEVFAPVATLHRYDHFDQAIAIANDSIYGLQAGVFTRDINRAWHAFESLDVGGVMLNQVPTWRSDIMPYGGAKQSGLGREGVRYAMEEMTEMRAMVMKVE